MADSTCSIDGCDRISVARGWCPKHYGRWWRNGDPVELHLDPDPPDVCQVEGCERGGRLRRGWCGKHYKRWQKHGDPHVVLESSGQTGNYLPVEPRIHEYSETDENGCWVWTAAKTAEDGYGKLSVEGTLTPAHRASYEVFVGPIPDGLDIDHLCRNRSCVNPEHLEPVTRRENLLRGQTLAAENAARTHCKRGHEFTDENTRIDSQGGRRCITCVRAYERRRSRRRRRGK